MVGERGTTLSRDAAGLRGANRLTELWWVALEAR